VDAIFMFFTDDPYAKKFIHLLIIEQYKNNEASRLFREWFIGGPIDFQTALFRQMMKEGFFRMADPYAAAVQFYGPMLLLMLIYDPQPEKHGEALELLHRHIEVFASYYHISHGENK